MDYENKCDWTIGENKPNSNPIKPNSRKAKMNANAFSQKDYRKYDDFAVRKSKPNSNPIKPTKGAGIVIRELIIRLRSPFDRVYPERSLP